MKKNWTMQRLKNICRKISISPLTGLYTLLIIVCGLYHEYLMIFSIVIFHECCHMLMAYYLKFEIHKVEILPFGAYLELNDFYQHSLSEELCVILAGPLSHIIIYAVIYLCVNESLQLEMMTMNVFIFIFNLLPIYPLDGSRIVGILLQGIMDLQRALYLQLKLSVLMLCVVLIFSLRISSVFIFMYLFYEQFLFLKMIPTILRKCFICLDEGKEVILHHNYTYRRGKKNYYMSNGKIYDAFHFYKMLLKSIK